MYEPNCGLDKVMMSFGHDEYMYRVLVGNGCKLPEEALYMVRYHSFYPWHTGGAYSHLCNDKDMEMIKWIREFKYSLPDPLCLSLNVSIVL
jgi:inositol oxygenase